MLTFLTILAMADPNDFNPLPDAHTSSLTSLGMREIFLIIGVAVVLGLLIFLVVYFAHKRRRTHHTSQGVSKAIYRAEKKSPAEMASPSRTKMRRRRRRHPENLPRNPTLGETGGLPPMRPEEPPPELAKQ